MGQATSAGVSLRGLDAFCCHRRFQAGLCGQFNYPKDVTPRPDREKNILGPATATSRSRHSSVKELYAGFLEAITGKERLAKEGR